MIAGKSGWRELLRLGCPKRSAELRQALSLPQPKGPPQRQSEDQSPAGITDGFLGLPEREVSEERLKELAYQESLTGLANRLLFYDRLPLVLSPPGCYGYKAAMIMLDIDPLKTSTDIRGHFKGDLLLKSIGQRLTSQLRKADTVARLGGNKFGIIATRISREKDAAKIAQRILNLLQQPFLFEDNEFWIASSIGVALYPKDADDPQTLMKNADIAMNYAKVAGRNNFQHYSPGLKNSRRQEDCSRHYASVHGPCLETEASKGS